MKLSVSLLMLVTYKYTNSAYVADVNFCKACWLKVVNLSFRICVFAYLDYQHTDYLL
jgi:hypothetical protein